MACCLWPDLLTAARERTWEQVLQRLLAADLPVAVYDMAVDLLYDQRDPPDLRPYRPRQTDMPWRDAGFANRNELLAELRRAGYDGAGSKTVRDLWSLLSSIRSG